MSSNPDTDCDPDTDSDSDTVDAPRPALAMHSTAALLYAFGAAATEDFVVC